MENKKVERFLICVKKKWFVNCSIPKEAIRLHRMVNGKEANIIDV